MNTLENANEPPKQESTLITHKNIQNTPFTITGNEEAGYFARLGTYRITEYYETTQEAIDEIEIHKWDTILKLILIVIKQEKENPTL